MGHMSETGGSLQRSFRLSQRTLELLDEVAAAGTETRNALVDRILGEAIRTERHPLIRFHGGASGHRRPLVIGTRLYVHQVIHTLREDDGDIEITAEDFGISPHLVRAALAYYADFKDEVDADAEADNRYADAERARWERQQQVLK
jgi:uncharacterized protein (DUF433 family)